MLSRLTPSQKRLATAIGVPLLCLFAFVFWLLAAVPLGVFPGNAGMYRLAQEKLAGNFDYHLKNMGNGEAFDAAAKEAGPKGFKGYDVDYQSLRNGTQANITLKFVANDWEAKITFTAVRSDGYSDKWVVKDGARYQGRSLSY